MKSLVFVLSLSFIAVPVFAGNFNDDSRVDFISWCVQDNLMAYNDAGQVYVKLNCSEFGQVCKSYELPKGPYILIVAACEKKD